MIIVQQAVLHPGVCALTGTADGPFVDMLTQGDFDSRRYVSVQMIGELATFVGGHSPLEASQAEAALDLMVARIAELEQAESELEELKAAVATTLTYGPAYGDQGKPKLRRRAPKAPPKAKAPA